MHAKFLLLEGKKRSSAWLGSYNFNNQSLKFNAELLLRTSDPAIVAALGRRFDRIASLRAGEADIR